VSAAKDGGKACRGLSLVGRIGEEVADRTHWEWSACAGEAAQAVARCAVLEFPALSGLGYIVSRPDKEVGMQKAHLRRWQAKNFKLRISQFEMKT
jgi:hypothetical protein